MLLPMLCIEHHLTHCQAQQDTHSWLEAVKPSRGLDELALLPPHSHRSVKTEMGEEGSFRAPRRSRVCSIEPHRLMAAGAEPSTHGSASSVCSSTHAEQLQGSTTQPTRLANPLAPGSKVSDGLVEPV